MHTLENGKIPIHIINNLKSFLCRNEDIYINWLRKVHNNKHETMLVGYVVDESDGFSRDCVENPVTNTPIYTHRIFNSDVQELD